jgi:hypothetical protein
MIEAPMHGLGSLRHNPAPFVRTLQEARTPYDQGVAEVEASRVFLRLARDLNAGMFVPSEADSHIKREVLAADPLAVITVFPRRSPRRSCGASPLRRQNMPPPERADAARERHRPWRLGCRGAGGQV